MSVGNKCEVHFFCVKGEIAAEIHLEIVSVYSKDVIKEQNLSKSCVKFKIRRSDVYDLERSGRLSTVGDRLIQSIDGKIAFICI